MVTYEQIRDFALTLPGVEEGTSYGTPALKVRGKLLARLREEGVLVVRVGADAQEALIAMEPEVYFITPHYAGSWAVLVRLEVIEESSHAGTHGRDLARECAEAAGSELCCGKTRRVKLWRIKVDLPTPSP